MAKERSIDTLTIDGGILCLNFINTVYAWRGVNLHEYLGDFTDMIRWSQKIDLLDKAELDQLEEAYTADRIAAEKALLELKDMRSIFYKVFSAIAMNEGARLDAKLLEQFNGYVSRGLASIKFIKSENLLLKRVYKYKSMLFKPQLLIILSAYELINSKQYTLVKECPSCGWLFIDTTKNKKRRWCSPLSCGSADKAKRYYENHKSIIK